MHALIVDSPGAPVAKHGMSSFDLRDHDPPTPQHSATDPANVPRRANACAAVEDHISTEARFGFSQCGAGPWSQAKSSSRMESLFCAVLVRIAPQHIPSCCFEPCQCGTSILRAPRRPKDRHTERIREALLWPPMSEPVPTASTEPRGEHPKRKLERSLSSTSVVSS